MSRVGFILKEGHRESQRLYASLTPWLTKLGHDVVVAQSTLDQRASRLPSVKSASDEDFATSVDVTVTLGGDGTMLRANVLLGDSGVPVLGINLGRLGFLAPFDPSQAKSAIEAALAGKLSLVKRMRLDIAFTPKSGGTIKRSALNDVVINQQAMARMLELEARLDDDFIATYRADGLIVASPTGSTAYNLAAGGPIVYPGHQAMAITPICAHALTNRPLVVSQDQKVTITIADPESRGQLTIDGQWAHPFVAGDQVCVTTAEHPFRVFTSEQGYFDILRKKLHWGVRSPSS